jgi:hypothetical protein
MRILSGTPIDRYDTTSETPQITTLTEADLPVPLLTRADLQAAWENGSARPLTWDVGDAADKAAIIRVTAAADEYDYLITYN